MAHDFCLKCQSNHSPEQVCAITPEGELVQDTDETTPDKPWEQFIGMRLTITRPTHHHNRAPGLYENGVNLVDKPFKDEPGTYGVRRCECQPCERPVAQNQVDQRCPSFETNINGVISSHCLICANYCLADEKEIQ